MVPKSHECAAMQYTLAAIQPLRACQVAWQRGANPSHAQLLRSCSNAPGVAATDTCCTCCNRSVHLPMEWHQDTNAVQLYVHANTSTATTATTAATQRTPAAQTSGHAFAHTHMHKHLHHLPHRTAETLRHQAHRKHTIALLAPHSCYCSMLACRLQPCSATA
jgi:hypothetical protein